MVPDYVTFSDIIIDDIVLWDGRTLMGTLGGGGTHALIGMRVWSNSLGFVAVVGEDFAPEQRAQLARIGIDLSGVRTSSQIPTARAWQILEADDRRIEIFRTDIDDFFRHSPSYAEMPLAYRQARGIHLLWGTTCDKIVELIDRWHKDNPAARFVWEPGLEHFKNTADEIGLILQRIALFSPDIDQAKKLTGESDPLEMAKTFVAWGAPIVAIRMGARGSIVYTNEDEYWQIPAVPPAALVDVTGAGNAYCGGFIVGLCEGLSVLESALRAAVSASFALEQFGLPDFSEDTFTEAERRLSWARRAVAER